MTAFSCIVVLILLGMVSDALAHTNAGPETVYGSRRIVLAGILLAGIGFTVGWARLWEQRASRIRQLLFHLAGLFSVGLALLSPIDRYATSSFILHMIQHQLLMMLACPILLLANPLPAYLWGLPEVLRKRFGHLLVRRAPLRRLFETATLPTVAWTLYVTNLWFWHYPAIYDAALRIPWLHDLEHVAFFTTGILFWWPVIRPAPHFHATPSYVLRILYLVLALIQNALLSGLILLSPVVLYPHYETVAPLWNLSPMQDQLWGGFIMWSSGSMMYLLAVIVLLVGILDTGGEATVSRGHRDNSDLHFESATKHEVRKGQRLDTRSRLSVTRSSAERWNESQNKPFRYPPFRTVSVQMAPGSSIKRTALSVRKSCRWTPS